MNADSSIVMNEALQIQGDEKGSFTPEPIVVDKSDEIRAISRGITQVLMDRLDVHKGRVSETEERMIVIYHLAALRALDAYFFETILSDAEKDMCNDVAHKLFQAAKLSESKQKL